MNFPQEHSIASNPNPIQSPLKKPSDHHVAHHSIIIKSPFELGFFGGIQWDNLLISHMKSPEIP